MPDLIMEYSSSVDERTNVQLLLEELHQALIDSQLFDVSSICSRSIRIHQWLLGDKQDREDFIHVTLDVMSGQGKEQKNQLSERLIGVMNDNTCHIESLSVKVRECDVSYSHKSDHHV